MGEGGGREGEGIRPRRVDRGRSVVQPLPPSFSQKPELKPERVAAQKAIDGVLVPVIKKTPLMDMATSRRSSDFSLSKAVTCLTR